MSGITKPSLRTTRSGRARQLGHLSTPLANTISSHNIRSSPTSSQETDEHSTLVSSPPTSPLRDSPSQKTAPATSITVKKAVKQSYFSFGLKDKKTCEECGMSYMRHIPADIKLHTKHHKVQTQGREWKEDWGSLITKINNDDQIVQVRPEIARAKAATLELMEVVNTELNAPDDNEFWLNGSDKGVVYVYVSHGRAVGLVSVEKIKEARWFSLDDGRIVSATQLPAFAGISRVYVSKKYRRLGFGMKLLCAIQQKLIYGMEVPKDQIAWSQPSFSGSKLAAQFNGRRHKSGKILVPVYT